MRDIVKCIFPRNKNVVAIRKRSPTVGALAIFTTTIPTAVIHPEWAELATLTAAAASEHRWPQAVRYVSRALDLTASLVGLVPVAGSAAKATIGTLVKILDAIAEHAQNTEDIGRLKNRLFDLGKVICDLPASSPQAIVLQGQLSRCLKKTSDDLNELLDRPKLQYQEVAQAISQCHQDVLFHIQTSTHQAVMYMLNEVERRATFDQDVRNPAMGCITLVDAFDNRHPIPMGRLRSLEQFQAEIRNLYSPHTQRNRILHQYMDLGLFDICLDDGTQVKQILTKEDLDIHAQPNTILVMRIRIFQTQIRDRLEYECPLCHTCNGISGESSLGTVECRYCERRLQITQNTKDGTGRAKQNETGLSSEDRALVRNIVVETQLVVPRPPGGGCYRKVYLTEYVCGHSKIHSIEMVDCGLPNCRLSVAHNLSCPPETCPITCRAWAGPAQKILDTSTEECGQCI